MVSVVTGSGNGLVNTSKDVLGGAGGMGQAATGRAGEQITVNAANGNLVIQDRDEYLVGVGPDVDLLRTYNSQGGWDGDNADGWRVGYYRQVTLTSGPFNADGSVAKRVEADGTERSYTCNAGVYVSNEGGGQYDTLSYAGGVWTWTDGDSGVKETYALGNGIYRLTQVTQPEGHFVAVTYNASGLIDTLGTYKAGSVVGTNAPDEKVTLTYSGNQLGSITTSYLDAGQAKTRSVTSYTYYPAGSGIKTGKLQAVTTDLTPTDTTDAKAYTVTYDYDANGRLSSLQQTDGSRFTVEYYGDGRVKSLKDDQNRLTSFSYDAANGTTTVTDPLSQATTLKYGAAGQLLEMAGAALGGASFKQSYTYNSASGDLLTSTNAKGETTTYAYDGTGGGNGAWTRRTDAAGNVTERSYDATSKLLLSETVYSVADTDGPGGPAPTGGSTTRYIYGSNIAKRQLAYVVGPGGQATSYTYDAKDQLQRRTTYTAAYYTSTSFTLSALSGWATSQPASAARQVTDYAYDLRGQVTQETRYATGSSGEASIAQTTYDAFGQLLSRQDGSGVKLSYEYDGLGRVTKTTDTNGVQTLYSYDDQNRKTSVQLDNGQTTVQLFDTQGNLVSSDVLGAGHTDANPKSLGQTLYSYDALGRLWRVQDATGVASYSLYDVSGRKSADIAPNGQLTEYFYDGAGRLIQSIAYSKLLDSTTLQGLGASSTIAGARPAADTVNDRITTYYYDTAGRLQGRLDADGYLVENQYDGASNLVKETRYATAQNVVRLSTANGTTQSTAPLLTRPALDAVNDRVTRNLYDVSGQLAAQINGENVLTVWTYDGAGNKRSQLRRSAPLSATEQTYSLSQLQTRNYMRNENLQGLNPLADDEFTQWIYDDKGQLIAQLDAEGALTEYSYDGAGRLQGTSQYLKQGAQPIGIALVNVLPPPIDPVTHVPTGQPTPVYGPACFTFVRSGSGSATVPLDTLRAGLGTPLKTSRSYNTLGLLLRETAVDGTQTLYQYDNLQRLQSVTRAESQPDARTQLIGYDDWGRVQTTSLQGDAAGVTATYDAAGRKTSTTDARGTKTVYYYDAQGRQQYAILIDPLLGGEVSETIYSNFNELTVTVTHAQRLGTTLANGLAGGATTATLAEQVTQLASGANGAKDNKQTVLYNRRGLIQQAIDALGYKTDTSYNAFGQVDNTITDTGTAASGLRRLTTTYTYDRRGDAVRREFSGTGVSNVATQAYFDALGRLQYSIDERNQTTNYTYLRDTGNGRQVTVSDPAGDVTTTYDALERVVSRKDRNNHTVSYTYDAVARTMTMTTEEGVQVVTETTRHGQVYKVTDAFGTTTYAYDTHGNLLTTTDAAGNVTKNTYDLNDNLTQVIHGLKSNGTALPTDDGSAVTTGYSYDAADRMLTQTVNPGAQQLVTTYKYDGQGRRVEITDPRGTVTTQSFNAKGELQEVVIDPVNATDSPEVAAKRLKLKTSYSYDAQSRVLTVIEGDGTAAARRTDYKYDALGNRTEEIVDLNGIALRTRYEYDAAGHVLVKRNALDEVVGRYRYDGAGRLLDSIDGTGAVTRNVYDKGQLKATLALPTRLGAGWATDLDSALSTKINALIDGGEAVNLFVYDKDGRLTYSVNAAGEVSRRIYDKANRVVETVRYETKLSSPTAATVDALAAQAAGLTEKPLNQHSYARYDAIGRLTYSVDATGAVSRFEYDRNGHVVKQSRYANRITLPLADGVDPSVTLALSSDRIDYFLYDSAGREQFHVDAEGYVTETLYDDASGTVITRRYVDRLSFSGTPTASAIAAMNRTGVATFGRQIDRAGRLSVESDNGVRTVTAYDEAGRVKSVTQAEGLAEQTITSYSYNTAGQRTEMTVASGSAAAATTKYRYDGRGNLQWVVDPRVVPLTTGDTAWERAERKRLGYMEALSDVSEGAKETLKNIYSTEFTYDLMGRVIRFKQYLDTYNQVITVTEYDAFGNASVITDPRGNKSYQVFDKANRLVQSIDAESYLTVYSYDAFGNLQSSRHVDAKVSGIVAGKPVAYAANDALDSVASASYDKANRLLTRTEWANSDNETYTEGASGSLNAFGERDAAINKLGGVTSYSYDKLGRLTQETLPVTSTNEEGAEAKNAQGVAIKVTNAYEYDSRGNRVKATEAVGLPEERVTEMRYDEANRLVYRIGRAYTAVNADGSTVSYTPVDYTGYDRLGRVIEVVRRGNWSGSGVVSGTGSRSLTYYNSRGDVVARIAPDGAYTTYTLDAVGNVFTETALAQVVTMPAATGTPPAAVTTAGKDRTTLRLYDQLNRMVEVQVVGMRYWESTGSDDSNFTTALQTPGVVKVRKLAYDASGNIVQDTDARGNSVYRYYDKLGRQTLSIDQEGYATAWDYGRHFMAATSQTRYAGALTSTQYVRQDDFARNAALRDPVGILGYLSPIDRRKTEYDLDRLGRVTEQRVLDVAASVVDASGNISTSSQTARTQYFYNGLDAVRLTREYVGAGTGGTGWNETTVKFDLLGRETQRIAPVFKDYRGTDVQPTTDTRYDGLSAVTRIVKLGETSAQDRVTKYRYDHRNGDLTGIVDANGNLTSYAIGTNGQPSRVTINVSDANGATHNVIKTYVYDALGRVTTASDIGTGEVRRTRYNAFGQVEARGLGTTDVWQERIDYNVLGKIERSNSGDGVTKLYIYDRNGNATRQITSTGIDLRTVSLDAAAVDATLIHSFSAYNNRNLLIKTADIKISYLKDQTTLSSAFTKQLTDLYGAITVAQPDPVKILPTEIAGSGGVFYAAPISGATASTLMPTAPGVATMGRSWVEGAVHTGAAEVSLDGNSNASATILSFTSAFIGVSGNGTVYYRRPGQGDWTGVSITGNKSAALPAGSGANGQWALVIAKADGTFYRLTYTVTNGVAALDRDKVSDMTVLYPSLDIPVAYSPGLSSQTVITVEMRLNGYVVTGTLSGTPGNAVFSIPWSQLDGAALGVNKFTTRSLNYTYTVYASFTTTQDRKNPVGYGSGTCQAGCDGTQNIGSTAAAQTRYLPWVKLSVNTVSLSGSIELRDPANGQYSALPPLDLRRFDTGADTLISLQDFIPSSGMRTVALSYTALNTNYTGQIDLYANGYASLRNLTATPVNSPSLAVTLPGATRLSLLHLIPGGDPRNPSLQNLAPWTGRGASQWSFNWPIYSNQTGWWYMYYEAVDANESVVAKGIGAYFVEQDGRVTQTSMTPDSIPDYLTLTPPANTTDFTLKYRVKGSNSAWTTVTRGNGLIIDGNRLRLPASGLMPAGGAPYAEYEYTYEAKNASAAMLSKGGGAFQVVKSGVVVPTSSYQERVPLQPIVFKGSAGRSDATYMRVTYTSTTTGLPVTVDLLGAWVSTPLPGYFQYTWDKPFDGRSINGEENYNIQLALCKDTNGTPVKDEAGNDIVTRGVMKVGGSFEKPWEIKQNVVSITKDAQVKRFQTWNAFGEVASEFDERVLERAQAQVAFYNSTASGLKGASPYVVDASAVKTEFVYNTLGKLIKKTDPQTFETMENGFIRRIRPLTEYGYDLLGRLTVSTDANKHQSKVHYDGDGDGNRIQWAADNGQSKQLTDIFGDVRLLENALHAQTEQGYDALGRLTSVHRKGVSRVQDFGATEFSGTAPVTADTFTYYSYDALGRRISHTDALGQVDKTWYDDLNRVVKTRSAANRETSYSYEFAAAGVTGAGAVLGVGGASVGGYKLTTTSADGRTTVDKTDYFGRTTWHQDLAGRGYTYTYNLAGQLAKQTSTTGQNIEYTYLQNGMIAEARDLGMHTLSRYGYDDAGNRTSESYSQLQSDNATISSSYQTSTIAYDELGRIARVWDGVAESTGYDLAHTHDVRYEYDAVGNRRAVHALYWHPLDRRLRAEEVFYYTYDEADRFTITKGMLNRRGTSETDTGASISLGFSGSQAVKIGYDKAGQRTSATTVDGTVETYTYSSDGYLEDTYIKTAAITAPQLRARRRVDAIGRTVEYKEWSADNNTVESTASSYDNDNRLLTQKFVSTNTLNPSNNSNYTLTYSYYKDKSDQLASWDGAGALASVSQSGITTLYTYDYWDDAKQLLITKRTADQNTTTTLGYDLNGHIKSNVDAGTGITQDYITNANGQVLLRMNSGTPYQNYYYADGHRVGEVGNVPGEKSRMSYAEQLYRKSVPETADQRRERYKRLNPVTSVDFDQNYEPINDSYPGRAASNYAVRRNGETLRSVAQALWGDSSMWYLIAEANGMLDDTSLSAGQVLVIPNKVTNIHNNASTWRPYNPGEAIGNVDPNWSAANIQGIKDFPAKLSELISHAISSAMWTTSSLGSSSSYSYQPAYSDPFGFDRAFFGNGAKEKDDAALDKAKKALKSGDIAQQREALTGLVSRPEFTGAVAQQVAIQQLLDVSYNFSASLGTPLDSGSGMQMGAVSVAGWNWSGQGLGAFGNAISESLAQSNDPLGDFIAKNKNWAHVSVGPIGSASQRGEPATFGRAVAQARDARDAQLEEIGLVRSTSKSGGFVAAPRDSNAGRSAVDVALDRSLELDDPLAGPAVANIQLSNNGIGYPYGHPLVQPVVITGQSLARQAALAEAGSAQGWANVYDEYGLFTMPGSAPIWNRIVSPAARATQRVAEVAVAMKNDPLRAAFGGVKGVVNLVPETVNLAINTVKLGLNGYSYLFGDAGASFRSTSAWNAPVWEAHGDAELGGSVLGSLAGPGVYSRALRLGAAGYGYVAETATAVRTAVGASEGWSALAAERAALLQYGGNGVIPSHPELMAMARFTLDFGTTKNGALFWSGAQNMEVAQWFGRATGKTTLEQTAGGRLLDELKLFDNMPGAQAAAVWDVASLRFAEGTSGTVNAFTKGATPVGPYGLRTWWKIERPALELNPDVNRIREWSWTMNPKDLP